MAPLFHGPSLTAKLNVCSAARVIKHAIAALHPSSFFVLIKPLAKLASINIPNDGCVSFSRGRERVTVMDTGVEVVCLSRSYKDRTSWPTWSQWSAILPLNINNLCWQRNLRSLNIKTLTLALRKSKSIDRFSFDALVLGLFNSLAFTMEWLPEVLNYLK